MSFLTSVTTWRHNGLHDARHSLLFNGAAALAAFEGSFSSSLLAAGEEMLSAWKPGDRGHTPHFHRRGNSALMIMPDGTTMLIDAGALYRNTPWSSTRSLMLRGGRTSGWAAT